VGAGLGGTWGKAKDSHAEIHPKLLNELRAESASIPIYKEKYDSDVKVEDIIYYFESRIYEFRRHKIKEYIENEKNWYKEIHPAIGSLINSEFNYGRGPEASDYVDENGKKYSNQEFLAINIKSFIEENKLDVDYRVFILENAVDNIKDMKSEESDKQSDEYDDSEESTENMEIDSIDESIVYYDKEFKLVDEDNKIYGTSLQDIIRIFGACILDVKNICGIMVSGLSNKQKEMLIDYISSYITEDSTENSKRLIFLKDGNLLYDTKVYVRGISQDSLIKQYRKIISMVA